MIKTCAKCGVQRGGLDDLKCSCDVFTFMANLPDRVVDIVEWSPSTTDDPVDIANRWNGYCGTREPDFSMSAEDTASFLASAVIKHAKIVEAAKAWADAYRLWPSRTHQAVQAATHSLLKTVGALGGTE